MNDQESEGWVSTQIVEKRFAWMTQRPARATKSSAKDVPKSERDEIGNNLLSIRLAKFAWWPVEMIGCDLYKRRQASNSESTQPIDTSSEE